MFKIFCRSPSNTISLTFFVEHIFNPFMAAFRKGFGCQSSLLRLLEDWRSALDNHKSAAVVLMDLSKAKTACLMGS